LFDKIQKERKFSEKDAAFIMKQVISAVYFYHLNNDLLIGKNFFTEISIQNISQYIYDSVSYVPIKTPKPPFSELINFPKKIYSCKLKDNSVSFLVITPY